MPAFDRQRTLGSSFDPLRALGCRALSPIAKFLASIPKRGTAPALLAPLIAEDLMSRETWAKGRAHVASCLGDVAFGAALHGLYVNR